MLTLYYFICENYKYMCGEIDFREGEMISVALMMFTEIGLDFREQIGSTKNFNLLYVNFRDSGTLRRGKKNTRKSISVG